MEPELFIVVGAHEFGGVQRAFFKGLVDLARRDVLCDHAQLAHGFAEQAAAHAHLQALEVGDGFDFLAVPAAHLGARVACAAALHVELRIEGVHQLAAVAVFHPGIHLPGGQSEWHGAAKGERRVLAGEVIGCGLGHFDRALLYAVHDAKGRHQLTGRMHRHFKLAAGEGLDGLGKRLAAAENCVQGLGETRSHAPAHGGLCMGSGGDARGQDARQAGVFDDGTAIQKRLLSGLQVRGEKRKVRCADGER